MPIGDYPDFKACVADQVKKCKSKESAQKICGYLEKKMTKAADAVSKWDKVKKLKEKDKNKDKKECKK